MKRTLAVVSLMAIVLVVSSCRGSTSSAPTNTSTAAALTSAGSPTSQFIPTSTSVPKETPRPAATAAPRPGATATPKPSATTAADLGSDALALLQKVITSSNKPDYRATYKITGLSENLDSNKEYTTTYFRKGKLKRLDSTSGGQATSMYISDTEVTSCDKLSGTWTCMKMSGELATMSASMATILFDATEELISEAINQGEKPVQVKSGKIAGQDAQIYVFEAPAPEKGEMQFAYTTDGIFLMLDYHTQDGKNDGRIEATEFSRQVSDSDFVPPPTAQ